jgi:hypothetical protein
VAFSAVMVHHCSWPGCFKSFPSAALLERHVHTQHQQPASLSGAVATAAAGAVAFATSATFGVSAITNASQAVVVRAAQTPMLPPIEITNPWCTTRRIADTLFDWELEHRVPQSVKQKQKEHIEKMYQAKKDVLQSHVDMTLQTQLEGLDLQGRNIRVSLNDCKLENEGISTFFPEALKTIHLERKYARVELGVVEHEVLHLGTSEVTITTASGEEHVVQSQDECIIFPFAQQVAQVMQQQDLYEAMQAFRSQQSSALQRMPLQNWETDTIATVYDGWAWRTNPFHVIHRGAYSLAFYYDDVTVTNPLGQYKRKVCSMWRMLVLIVGCHMCRLHISIGPF